jgi:hypothetical protein
LADDTYVILKLHLDGSRYAVAGIGLHWLWPWTPMHFRRSFLSEFPTLQDDFEEWAGLLHLQISEFLAFTQAAIEAGSFGVVSRCFGIANAALIEGNDSLRNAIYVSYLEHLDFRTEGGKQAKQLMPTELMQGRNDILDYNEQLLGRKWPTDDR